MTRKEYNNRDIKKLYDHAKVANEEMGHIKDDIILIKNDMVWIKEAMQDTKKTLEKFDSRTWTILATIVIGFLANLYFK